MISVKEIKKCKEQQIRTGFFSVFFVYDKWIFVEYQTVLVFYFFRSREWWNFMARVILLAWISIFLILEYDIPLNFFGNELNVSSQTVAIFSLVFIWLYNGKQSIHNKITKYMFYSLYPLHLLLIVLLKLYFILGSI